jgi:hypothetical protein
MRNYLLGVASGLAIYHYILGGGGNQELIKEMRGWVKSVDDRLAEAEKKDSESEQSEREKYGPVTYHPTPPESPPEPPQAA